MPELKRSPRITDIMETPDNKVVAVLNNDPRRSILVTRVLQMFEGAATVISRRGGTENLVPVKVPLEPPTIRETLERLRIEQ